MLWGISERLSARAFKPLPLCSAFPWKLLVGISGALGTKESHFLITCFAKRCFEKMLWSISLSKKNMCVLSQKDWVLPNLCHCVLHPWKLTSRDFWSSRNKRKPLSQLKHVLRKCSGVSQKQRVLELLNLCHCVLHPWKLTNRDFWCSRNKRKPLSQLIHVLRKCCGVSQKHCHCYSFQTFAIVFCTTENLLVGISGALGTKESHFLSKNVFWKNAVGYLRNSEC